ncbi:hypothetical protein [Pelovirga terrestris]|uniref:DUF3618 domain-containing protein n=1 Tax=Pelovirga terrestris TaxID=2771352 RepID=A0A8J6QX83_9BACT|nr:hypothetical protein [Pelovirga terrestris]MBD1400581.1 hypothetical protein [Pelovirga terrestris]
MEYALENTSESVTTGRSSEEIKQDLAAKEENFSRTVEQLGERIEEKLDWRGQVKKTPFWAVGMATGLGFFAAGIVLPRATPMERFRKSLNSSVRGALYGLAGPGLLKVTLLGIAAQAATHWLNNVPADVAAADSDREQPSGPQPAGTAAATDRDG